MVKRFRTLIFGAPTVGALICGFLMAGCALVKPLEREYLGDPILRLPEDELENRLDNHRFPRREGSTGAGTGSGAGCGC